MAVSLTPTAAGFDLVFDGAVVARLDDLSFTAWGERHRLCHGGLEPEPAVSAASHDEVGSHEVVTYPFVTRSVRQAVRFRLAARCYDLEPVILVELLPGLGQPAFGTEECASCRLAELPGCAESVYLHQRITEYGRNAVGSWWAQASWLADPTRDNPWDWGLCCCWRREDGSCLALVPMRAGGAVARLRGDAGGLEIVASGWCGQQTYPRLPLAVLARGETPAAAMDQALGAASRLCEWSFLLRDDKPYPPALEYLGWSSWGGLGSRVNLAELLASMRSFAEQALPIRWLWLEEGWQQLDASRRLAGFDADPGRFPGGLKEAVRRLQGEAGLRAVGVWTTLQGSWAGIAPALLPAEQRFAGTDGTTVPAPEPAGRPFWSSWFEHLRDSGIDLVRVDNQGSGRNLYLGRRPLDEAVGGAIKNVETAASEAGLDLAAGMSLHLECLYHYGTTNVVRASGDIVPGDRRAAKLHLTHSVMVAAWLSRIAWPDFDAFPSRGPAARAFAVMAALSGGPIYLADPAGQHDPELIRSLCLADGRLLLPAAPGQPPATRFFADPLTGDSPLMMVAPAGSVPRREPSVGIDCETLLPSAWQVGLVNVRLDGRPLTVDLTPREVTDGSAARYAIEAHFSRRRWLLEPDQTLRLELAELEAEALTVAPVRDGAALLGLSDKLLSGCGAVLDHEDLISVPEPGRVLLYDNSGRRPSDLDRQPFAAVDSPRTLQPGELRRDGDWFEIQTATPVFRRGESTR